MLPASALEMCGGFQNPAVSMCSWTQKRGLALAVRSLRSHPSHQVGTSLGAQQACPCSGAPHKWLAVSSCFY